jgi:transglutaminase superfamily protein
LLRAFVALAVVSVELRFRGVRRLASETSGSRDIARAIGPEQVSRAREYFRWVEVASRRHILRTRCLHRSLVLHRWLLHDGVPSQLRIGVRKDDGTLRAHAWVEIDGEVVGESAAHVAKFTPLTGLRPAGVSGRLGSTAGRARASETVR